MTTADDSPITALLQRAAAGDRAAYDEVFASLYPDLKRIARARLRQQGRGDNLDTTALVHESFLRLAGARTPHFEDRRHFFAYAAKAMRHEIIDSAREMLADRRGNGIEPDTLGSGGAGEVADTHAGEELIRVNDALLALEGVDPGLAQVVEMRYFGGYSETEIADLLGVNERTVRRHWDKARAFLFVELGNG